MNDGMDVLECKIYCEINLEIFILYIFFERMFLFFSFFKKFLNVNFCFLRIIKVLIDWW